MDAAAGGSPTLYLAGKGPGAQAALGARSRLSKTPSSEHLYGKRVPL